VSNDKSNLLTILGQDDLGFSIARAELNKCLIEKTLNCNPGIQFLFHLMEGQSWEIALVDHASKLNKKTIGVIHLPFRQQDTQILNYFLCDGPIPIATKMFKILCVSENCYSSLKLLGCSDSQVELVEAQRFMPVTSLGQHSYSSKSKSVLYVADANLANLDAFYQLTRTFLAKEVLSDYDFFVQFHPAAVPKTLSFLRPWDSKKNGIWGLVIFGPETSTYLQPQFAESNVRFLSLNHSHTRILNNGQPLIPAISSYDEIRESIQNPVVPNQNGKLMIDTNPRFVNWRKVINEILES
jgi:hypothetical protein